MKFEGANPTGSFKDRGMSVGVTLAKALGARGIVVASTGNTAASAAAYASRAGLECVTVVPRGKIAPGKAFQLVLHGAKIVEVEGFFDDALRFVMELCSRRRVLYPLNSFNPWRLEGQKTIAYEIVAQLRRVPDIVVVPVGNAGNISAIWKGFAELYRWGLIEELPRMVGVQAAGADPLVKTWKRGANNLVVVENPTTIASAIRIGRPVNWFKALKAVRESRGLLVKVSDEEILEAQKMLARDGVGVEPASAASLAGYLKLREDRVIDRNEVVVLIATGHALKDPSIANRLEISRFIAKNYQEFEKIIENIV